MTTVWTLSTTTAAGGLRLGVLALDLPGREVNVLDEDVLRELGQRLDEAQRQRFEGLVVMSGKPGVFIAGADVKAIERVRTEAEGEQASKMGQAVLRRFSQLGMPTVAAIDGACVGGGLELALWCWARTCTPDERTRIGLPEVRLGIVPGFGGTQRLPRLVGLPQAISLASSGRLLSVRQALRAGLVDSVVPREHLLSEAATLVRALRGQGEKRGRARLAGLPFVRGVIHAIARRRILAETRGKYPAPPEAARLCLRSLQLSLDRGLALEAAALGRLVVSPVARNLLHVHDLTREANAGAVAPPAGALVGVLGAGVMGGGIAGVAAARGHAARLRDLKDEALADGMDAACDVVRRHLRNAWRPDVAVQAALDRLSGTLGLDGFAQADLVVEAVVEREDVKRRVLAEAEAAVGERCLLATNTSSLSVGRLAAGLQRPELFAGLHFFNPVPRMPLVEIVRGPATSDSTVARLLGWSKAMGKYVVVVADTPGFLVNRLLGPYLREALLLVEEGVPVRAVDDAAVDFGMPMGPVRLLDEVGLDVAQHVQQAFAAAFPDRLAPSALLASLVQQGRLGKKSGGGFYDHRGGDKPIPWRGLPPPREHAPRPSIQDRLLLPMADEAYRCLAEGVCASPRTIDLATVMGIGFPPFRGGLCKWVQDEGAAVMVSRMQALAGALGSRLAPSPAFADSAR